MILSLKILNEFTWVKSSFVAAFVVELSSCGEHNKCSGMFTNKGKTNDLRAIYNDNVSECLIVCLFDGAIVLLGKRTLCKGFLCVIMHK